VGDKIKGNTTDFEGTVLSMQEKNQSIEKASPGQMIGIKIKYYVPEHDYSVQNY